MHLWLQFEVCGKCFCVTEGVQPDELFGGFASFLTAMADARVENERMRRQKEEEEKRAQLEEKVGLLPH